MHDLEWLPKGFSEFRTKRMCTYNMDCRRRDREEELEAVFSTRLVIGSLLLMILAALALVVYAENRVIGLTLRSYLAIFAVPWAGLSFCLVAVWALAWGAAWKRL